METVIAKTVIHRATKPGVAGDRSKGIKAIPPGVTVIKPGTRFVPKDKAEFDELKKMGAIEVVKTAAAEAVEEEVIAKATTGKGKSSGRKAKAAVDNGGSDNGDNGGDPDLV